MKVGSALLLIALMAACSGEDGNPAPSPSTTAPASPSVSPSTPVSPTGSAGAAATPAPGPAATPPPDAVRSLGYPFRISVGETVTFDGEILTVTYERLVEDSRCPEDVQCVWAGNGRILLGLAKAGSDGVGLELNTMLEPRSGRYLEYSVSLVTLERGDSPDATLQVNRA